jgi:BirA family biotin operon repressor/biotin-[acetyl-CoA-carboxylase] ligase
VTDRVLRKRIEGLLATERLGRTLIVKRETASTMEDARALAETGADHGTVVVAERQSAGRGRLGRPFVSPPGGLYLTLVLDPPGDPALGWRAGFAAALAARDAIRSAGGPDLEFDWPNDLVLGERKVGGILLELLLPPRVPRPRLLLGIGLDIGPDPRTTDAIAAGPAGRIPFPVAGDRRPQVAAALLAALEVQLPRCGREDGWEVVLESVRGVSRAAGGRQLTVRGTDGTLLTGCGEGLREDGALLLRRADGEVVAVRYAERVYDAPAP